MIIDGHGHACGDYLNYESIVRYLTINNVDYVVLVPGQPNSKKTYKFHEKAYINNKEVLNGTNKLIKFATGLTNSKRHIPHENEKINMLKKSTNKIKQFYWALNEKSIDEIQTDYDRMKFEGIKIHQCWQYNNFTSIWFMNLIMWLIETDKPLFIHLYSNNDVEELMKIIIRYQKLKVIVAHCYGLEKIINLDLAKLENVYFDISNNYFVPKDRINNALNVIGSTKFALGSDTPYGQDALARTIKRVYELNAKGNEIDNILGNNMKCLLKI